MLPYCLDIHQQCYQQRCCHRARACLRMLHTHTGRLHNLRSQPGSDKTEERYQTCNTVCNVVSKGYQPFASYADRISGIRLMQKHHRRTETVLSSKNTNLPSAHQVSFVVDRLSFSLPSISSLSIDIHAARNARQDNVHGCRVQTDFVITPSAIWSHTCEAAQNARPGLQLQLSVSVRSRSRSK